MIRDDIKAAQITAMKAGDKPRVAATRLILAKIKDRDIELRTSEKAVDDDALVTEVLQKMAKQRRESITMFEAGGRQELADAEAYELDVITETIAAIAQIKSELDAQGPKDMGRVMAELKTRHGSVLDMSKVSGWVKAALV